MFSIDQFTAAIGSGVARPTMYRVTFLFNPKLPFARDLQFTNQLSIMCHRAEYPGKKIDSTLDGTYGPIRKMPYGMAYDDLSLSFYCTNSMFERRIIDAWMSIIYNPSSNYMSYYDDYKSNIVIASLQNTRGVQETYEVLIEEAYPSMINSVPLSYDETDAVMSVSLTLAYRRWRTKREVMEGDSYKQDRLGHLTNPNIKQPTGIGVGAEWNPPDFLDTQQGDLTQTPNLERQPSPPTSLQPPSTSPSLSQELKVPPETTLDSMAPPSISNDFPVTVEPKN